MAMLPLYSLIQLQAIEAQHPQLMPIAGEAAARWIAARYHPKNSILLLAGPGNNGGDAYATAHALRRRGFAPIVCDCSEAEQQLPADATTALEEWLRIGGDVLDDIPERTYDLVVDGLFGIGLNRPIRGYIASIIDWVNQLECGVLALDIPSGLNAFTGIKTGPCIQADWTLSFISFKAGLLTGRDADRCGQIFVDDLEIKDGLPTPTGQTLSLPDIQALLPHRSRASHKGLNGSVGIIGGNIGMSGAAIMAGRAALYAGAGRVYVGLLDKTLAYDPQQPELMLRSAIETLKTPHLSCLVVGPGLGEGSAALQALDMAIKSQIPLVLDADALNLMAHFPPLKVAIRQRQHPTLLTPHPTEAARLLHASTETVENDRVAAALELASEWRSHIVLKGSGSVVAFANQHYRINTTGNPGLSSAGQGDVLAGVIGSLLAQGLDAEAALSTGVCVHGAAADQLVSEGMGPIGLTASETLIQIRRVLNGHGISEA